MIDKIKDWYVDNQENFEFVYIITTIAFLLYALVWSVNWVLVTFLSFTGLKYILFPWIGWCVGWSIEKFISEQKNVD